MTRQHPLVTAEVLREECVSVEALGHTPLTGIATLSRCCRWNPLKLKMTV